MKIIQVIKASLRNNLGNFIKESTWGTELNHEIITIQDGCETFQDTLKEIERNYVHQDETYRFAEDCRVDDLEDSLQDTDYEQEKLQGRVEELESKTEQLEETIQQMQEEITQYRLDQSNMRKSITELCLQMSQIKCIKKENENE